jgi:hypothetical protein
MAACEMVSQTLKKSQFLTSCSQLQGLPLMVVAILGDWDNYPDLWSEEEDMNQADTSEGLGESSKHRCKRFWGLQKCIVSPRAHHFHHEEQPLRCKDGAANEWEVLSLDQAVIPDGKEQTLRQQPLRRNYQKEANCL